MWRSLNKLIDVYSCLRGNESYYQIFNQLNNLQYQNQESVKELNLKKINNLINYSKQNVEYYKETLSNLNDTRLQSLDEIQKIPILLKSSIRKNFPSKIVDQNRMNKAIYNTTSGSTGEPLEFYNDRKAYPYYISSYMYFNTLMQADPIDIHWNLKSTGNYSRMQRLNYWSQGKHVYSVMNVKRENVDEISSQIEQIKPVYLEGYSASLERLARYLSEENKTIPHKPKAIIATSENLSENGRELLETVFNSKVFIRYGSREFSGAVAQECEEHNGLHINPLLSLVEIVDENGDTVSEGEQGRVLITDLNNMVMPFIRYDIGDLAVQGGETCPCGRNFPLIESIEGRKGEFLISKEGEKIPFITISAYLFRRNFAPHIYVYQFVQREKGKITLRVVPTEKYSDTIHEEIIATLTQLLPGFEFVLKTVDDVRPEKTGKTPLLINLK